MDINFYAVSSNYETTAALQIKKQSEVPFGYMALRIEQYDPGCPLRQPGEPWGCGLCNTLTPVDVFDRTCEHVPEGPCFYFDITHVYIPASFLRKL